MDGPQGECDKHFTPVHLWGEGFFLSGRGIVGENFTLCVSTQNLVYYITVTLTVYNVT